MTELAGQLAHRDRRTFGQRFRRAPSTGQQLPVRLSHSDLRGIVRTPIDPGTPLTYSLDLRGAKLDSACLAVGRLHYALLDSADLTDAELPYVDLTSSSMVGTNLSFAKLPNAHLTFANLRCAKLGESDLTSADVSKASLEWAFLGGATLKGIQHWNDVRGLDSAYVADARELSESDRASAVSKRAIVRPYDLLAWTARATPQTLPDSICARPPRAGESP